MKTFLSLVMLSACSAGTWRHIDRTTLAMSTASIACDWGQTATMAAKGWDRGLGPQHEENPIMGEHPSVAVVSAYFMTALVINTAVWAVLPASWRSAIPTAITGSQTITIERNVSASNTLCGVPI